MPWLPGPQQQAAQAVAAACRCIMETCLSWRVPPVGVLVRLGRECMQACVCVWSVPVCACACACVYLCVCHTHTHSSNAPQPTRSYGLSSALCPVPAGHQRQGQSEQAALGEYLASATALSWRALLGMPHLEQMLAEVSLHASQLHAHARMHAAAAAAAASLACCPHTRPTWDGCSLRQVGSPGPVGLHSSNRPQGL